MSDAEKTIGALQIKVKQDADEFAALTKKHIELTSAKTAVDKQLESMISQNKKATDEIASLKRQLNEAEAGGSSPNVHQVLYYTFQT